MGLVSKARQKKDCVCHAWEFGLYLESDVTQLKDFKQSNCMVRFVF